MLSTRVIPLVATTGLSVIETRYTPGHVLGTHYHALACLSLVLAGGQEEQVGSRRHECTTRSVVFKAPQLEHSDHVGASGMHGLFVELSPDLLERFRDAHGVVPDVARHVDPAVHHLVGRVGAELRLRHAGYELAVEGLLYQLLATVARGPVHARPDRRPAWVHRAREYVEAHFREPLSLTAVAEVVGIHPSHLATSYQAAFGRTVGEHVRELRVEYARAALLDPARPLSEIALAAGFADQSHFTRLFRWYHGVAPGAYRRLAGLEQAPGTHSERPD